MRMVLSPAAVALIVLALVWGNCLSCPQMALAAQQSSHDCCHPTQPVKADCSSQTLAHFVKSGDTDMSPAVAPVLQVAAARVFQAGAPALPPATTTPEFTPPDLISLNSAFRI